MIHNSAYSKFKFLFSLSAVLILSGCGGGTSSPTPPPKTLPIYNISGMAVKGPLQFAHVTIYQFDSTKIDGLGKSITISSTDETARVKNLSIKGEISGNFVIEYTADDATIDITTGKIPAFKVLRNIVSSKDIVAKTPIYATPLSTLTLKLALTKLEAEGSIDQALSVAENEIKSVFGLGVGSEIDLLRTPPLLTNETTTSDAQINAWSMRTLNEISATLVYQLYIKLANESLSIDSLLDEIVKDLIDGNINGLSNDLPLTYSIEDIALLSQPLNSLHIAGTDTLAITNLKQIMMSEIVTTGYADIDFTSFESAELTLRHHSVILAVDIDQDGISNSDDLDNDNDGFNDELDSFPFNRAEWVDSDSDSIGDNTDADDDNDGITDELDVFPLDKNESADFDGDGIGNNADTDDDNDGVLDSVDAFPFDSKEWLDSDLDGIGNNADPDDDNDGASDEQDAFSLDSSEQFDSDGDGIGNNADLDDDNDGITDELDVFPFNPNEWLDTDSDGLGNNQDADDDGDGTPDTEDNFPLDSSEQLDNDGDGQGNNIDTDDDNDGYLDTEDSFPLDHTEWKDSDGDSLGNNSDIDDDNDDVVDEEDIFPLNPLEQSDFDSDGLGDNSDPDIDADGVLNADDAFPYNFDEWADNDQDSIGNNSDLDDDNDGVNDIEDAFPFKASEWKDFDNDGAGDNVDLDDDNDGIADTIDNITLGGAKKSYLTSEQITIYVRAKENNNTVLTATDGWHVQYQIYDMANPVNSDSGENNTPEKPITKYVTDGYYNGIYESNKQEWRVQFPAVDYAGTFKISISVYCSLANSMCGGQYREPDVKWKQEIFFNVVCAADSNCEYTPETEPGVNITGNEASAEVSSIIQRSNGELLTSYRLFGDSVYNAISRSSDFGESWQTLSTFESLYSSTNTYLYEDSNNDLLMITQCSLAICIVKYNEYAQWNVLSKLDFSQYKSCDATGCSYYEFSENSLIETNDGSYLLSYSASKGTISDTDIYVIKSDDLVTWSEAKKVANYQSFDFDSKLIQLADESYLIAYVSYDNSAIVIATSDDGETWIEKQKIPEYTHTSMNISLIRDGEKIRLFYSSLGNLYSLELDQSGQFTNRLAIKEDVTFGPLVVKMQDGTFVLVYSLDLNEKRDVFFENIGTEIINAAK